jgi:UDP-N-acetylmuramoyl-tripeptide--D-alanyl-D-alanine ligase
VVSSGQGVTFFVDCYNSSPRAARASLAFVAAAPAEGRRVAVLGDMLELGAASEAGHREVGEFAGQGHFDLVVGLGEGGRLIAEGARAAGMTRAATPFFQNKDELAGFLARELKKGDVVLLKASRAVRLEAILDKVGVEAQGG